MNQFEQMAKSEQKGSIFSEFWFFLSQTKKWWLVPIVVVLLAFGILMALSGTAAAPFIYTLF
jgi:Family of unknown function (DUF5989)